MLNLGLSVSEPWYLLSWDSMENLVHLSNRWLRLPVRAFQVLLAALLPGKVRAGPFKGVVFPKNWIGSALLPKLIGTYEQEISGKLKDLILDSRVDAFVDIGCAGGYYLAVAASLRKDLELYGVDSSSEVVDTLAEVSSIYGRVIDFKNKFAGVEDVLAACRRHRHPLFVVDIEGGEFELFRNLKSLDLEISQAVFVIEVHEYLDPSWRESLGFLEASHLVRITPFGGYYLHELGGGVGRMLGFLMRHELRHPKTSYLIAIPKDMSSLYGAAR